MSPSGQDLLLAQAPEPLEAAYAYAPSSPVVITTAEELSMPGSAATPPPPRLKRAGDMKSHIGEHFVLGGSRQAYRIWGFRSANSPLDVPCYRRGMGKRVDEVPRPGAANGTARWTRRNGPGDSVGLMPQAVSVGVLMTYYCPMCGHGLAKSNAETPEGDYYCPFCSTRQVPSRL